MDKEETLEWVKKQARIAERRPWMDIIGGGISYEAGEIKKLLSKLPWWKRVILFLTGRLWI
jgi:hypothetical protein